MTKANADIVAGGGWITRQTVVRQRTRWFVFLSVIWLGVSVGASFPFWEGWPKSFGYLEWLCIALLALQPVFVVVAIVSWLTEKPVVITEKHPNPDYDIRKLW